ncbi:MAG: HyaD/HybD family hydrogenase maturation endopeptidase [Candidatus Neomarinimicrobiota bacterium]
MSVPGNQPAAILVLGLGNILLQDEGVGVRAVASLSNNFRFRPQIDIVDGGTAGLDLLPEFDDREKILIVDAVEFNQPPGYIGLIENDAILVRIQTKLSIHHLGLADVLSAAKMLDKMPAEIVLVGVQPGGVNPVLELTPAVDKIMPRVLEAILTRLQQWGVAAERTAAEKRAGVFNLFD